MTQVLSCSFFREDFMVSKVKEDIGAMR